MALTEELVALLGEEAVVADSSEFARFEAGWRYGQGRAGAATVCDFRLRINK